MLAVGSVPHLIRLRTARSCLLLGHAPDPAVGLDAHRSVLDERCSGTARAVSLPPRRRELRAAARSAPPSRNASARRGAARARRDHGRRARVGLARGCAMSSGSAPSSGTPYCAAMRSPPPSPKMCSSCPQFEQTCMAHVLDDAEHRHGDLLEHLQRPCARRAARCPAAW